jgi:hypothetical protein
MANVHEMDRTLSRGSLHSLVRPRCLDLFLGWDLVEHVAKDLPRTVCLVLPDKQVLAAEMDLLPVPRNVTFENRGRDRDITHQVEAVPIESQRERHKVRIGDKLLVILSDRGLADRGFLLLGHEDRILVVKIGERLGVFLVRRGDPLLITILHYRFDLGFVVLRQGWQDGN